MQVCKGLDEGIAADRLQGVQEESDIAYFGLKELPQDSER